MMTKRSRSSEPNVELRVNLNQLPSPVTSSLSGSGSSSDISVENLCVAWEGEAEEEIITRSMMLVGCPGCFMYVMLTEKSSQCPKCHNNVFLDFFKQQRQQQQQHHA